MPSTATDHSGESDCNELAVLSSGTVPDEESQVGEGSGINIQAGIQVPFVGRERDPSSQISRDEGARLWKDLETESGFKSYGEYLGVHKNFPFYLLSLQNAFREMTQESDSYASSCAIVDVQSGNSTCKLNLRCYSKSGTEILSALYQPPAEATFGIVLWDSTSLDKAMLDALGLGLKIQPYFFSAFLARHPQTPARLEEFMDWRIASDVVVVGQYILTLVRNYLPANSDARPIILIAAIDSKRLHPDEDSMTYHEEFPFQKSASSSTRGEPMGQLPVWMRECVCHLESDIQKGWVLGKNGADIELNSLTPLLHFTMPLLRKECRVFRERYLKATRPTRTETVETGRKEIFHMRYLLRRMLEDVKDNSLRLRSFLHSQMKQDTPQDQVLMTLKDNLHHFGLEATRLETEIRDYLQLQIGELALQESKNSIALSNSQIEEAKRVKIFTILAFVYIPLNLATSIFGMNIEQLNGSGQHISVFITTAVVTLAVTGGLWFAIEQANIYRKWQRRRIDTRYSGKTQFAFIVRIAMLALLVWNGLSRWMFRSGIWWRILINHRSRIYTRYSDLYYSTEGLNAGEYVSKYSTKGQYFLPGGSFTEVQWRDVEQE